MQPLFPGPVFAGPTWGPSDLFSEFLCHNRQTIALIFFQTLPNFLEPSLACSLDSLVNPGTDGHNQGRVNDFETAIGVKYGNRSRVALMGSDLASVGLDNPAPREFKPELAVFFLEGTNLIDHKRLIIQVIHRISSSKQK